MPATAARTYLVWILVERRHVVEVHRIAVDDDGVRLKHPGHAHGKFNSVRVVERDMYVGDD